MTLIVAADDFGLCPEIDEAICALHDRGIVRRTSLLVNTPFFESSVAALRERPGLSVAIHLNLTDGEPVLPAAEVPSLVDSGGRFVGGRHYRVIARILGGRMRRDQIRREWREQIAKALRAGVAIEEINGHGHLHLLPALHAIVIELQREFAIPRIRLVHSVESPRGLLLYICSVILRWKLPRRGVPPTWPHRTLGFRRPGDADPRIELGDVFTSTGELVELIVHPAARPNAYHDRWGYRGDAVLQWLLRADEAP